MAIRINTNTASLSTQRHLSIASSRLNTTLERLSSGLRINRSADDAAGLAVSEKLRTQIRGFTQSIANGQDAANLIATAESGLDQTTQILQRMRELAIQSANDTLVNKDREKIQTEIEQLRLEITQIAETTEFNERKLLDGSVAQATFTEEPEGSIKQNIRVGNTSATVPALEDFFQTINSAFLAGLPTGLQFESDKLVVYSTDNALFSAPTVDVSFEFKIVSYQSSSAAPVSVAIEVYNSTSGFLYSVDPFNGASFLDQGGTEGAPIGSLGQPQALLILSEFPPPQGSFIGQGMGYVAISDALTLSDVGKSAVIQITPRREPVTTDQALTFHVGANEGQFIKMGIQDMRAEALRMETLSVVGSTDQDSRLQSQNAIGAIDAALDYVNTNRARLGAYQNRIEYRIQNLHVSRENIQASESRIRDVDVASETANLTRSQILVQAGTAILSQANIAAESALSLLG